ncbi:MAG: hypothetical protein E6Z06_00170 [Clostridiales bacterium]|nr:hypothetical protein [Clostridiales bacterium]MBS5916186.1 hypothetical protein [Clostridiales bacterium]MDU1028263.1 hypothetical protein [Clostridiales bacterium]MDU5951295.1 hypothetical protein [Clostridiales bacterium]
MKYIGIAFLTLASMVSFVISVGLLESSTLPLFVTSLTTLLSIFGLFIGLSALRIIEFRPYLTDARTHRD